MNGGSRAALIVGVRRLSHLPVGVASGEFIVWLQDDAGREGRPFHAVFAVLTARLSGLAILRARFAFW
jgi:hypothetical protein